MSAILTNGAISQLAKRVADAVVGAVTLHLCEQAEGEVVPPINSREYVLRCWPDVSEKTLQLIILRMSDLCRKKTGRPAPQWRPGEVVSGCDPDHLDCLMEAIAFNWRREHTPQGSQN